MPTIYGIAHLIVVLWSIILIMKGFSVMIKELIKKTGYELKRDYYKLQTCHEKERFHLVSKSDRAIEKILLNKLNDYYPDYSIYSEEVGEIKKKSNKRWIIDPIDGTADFVFGVPYFAISICLEENNEIIEGYVYNPISEELYYAKKGIGKAYLNDNVIKVSETKDINDSLIAVGFSTNYEIIKQYYCEWKTLFETCKKGMPLIAPALTICNVARGRIDAFVDMGSSMEGQSAASLILKNAGGKLYNYDFSKYEYTQKGIIATNGKLKLEGIRNIKKENFTEA